METNVSPLCDQIVGPGGLLIQVHECGIAILRDGKHVSMETIAAPMYRAYLAWREEGEKT